MKAALISLGSVSSEWTADALAKHFDTVDHLNVTDLEVPLGKKDAHVYHKGEFLQEYDCVYMRGSYRYASLLSAATTILQRTTCVPLKPDSFTIAHNKVLTHLRLQEHNVPQPTTYFAATAEAGKKLVKNINYPIVIKLPAGTHGKGVMFADSPESAKSMIDALAMLNQPFLMQEFVETNGTDYRAIIVGDKVVAAMKRKAARGEQRSNIHAGGVGERALLDFSMKKAAVQAAKACGAEICAVDLIASAKGPLVLEVNLSPGLQGVMKATKINVAEHIAEYLFVKAKERKQHGEKTVIKSELATQHEIEGKVDFRGNRILLPEFCSLASKITDEDDVYITATKGKIEIKKLRKT